MAQLLFLFLNCQSSRGWVHWTFPAEQWSNATDKKGPAITHFPRSGCLPAAVCLWIYLKLPSNSDFLWAVCSVPRRNIEVSLSATHYCESNHHMKKSCNSYGTDHPWKACIYWRNVQYDPTNAMKAHESQGLAHTWFYVYYVVVITNWSCPSTAREFE